MERRTFIRTCAFGMACSAAGAGTPPAQASPRQYSRARLVDEFGKPFPLASVRPGTNYVFHYPYAGTPCFLLDLGRPAPGPVRLRTVEGRDYEWSGGVGPRRTVVAYSAICAHQLAYPTRQISFISYRGEEGVEAKRSGAGVIHCCAEHSRYDPAAGGRVLGGPAPQPLAAILLEHDPQSDALHATGTLGGELFNAFFSRYEFKLSMEHGAGKARAPVGPATVVTELSNYCKQQVRC